MEFMKLAAQRYSVRKFSDAPIEPEKLSAVLEAGNVAPTAKNLQPQRITARRRLKRWTASHDADSTPRSCS